MAGQAGPGRQRRSTNVKCKKIATSYKIMQLSANGKQPEHVASQMYKGLVTNGVAEYAHSKGITWHQNKVFVQVKPNGWKSPSHENGSVDSYDTDTSGERWRHIWEHPHIVRWWVISPGIVDAESNSGEHYEGRWKKARRL